MPDASDIGTVIGSMPEGVSEYGVCYVLAYPQPPL